MRLTMRLPLLWCPDCGARLVNHLFMSGSVLVCVVCARRRVAEGQGAAPLHPDSAGFVPGADAPVPLAQALSLLSSLGARPIPAGGAQ